MTSGLELTSCRQDDEALLVVLQSAGVTQVPALVCEVHPGQTKGCVAPGDLVMEQGGPSLVERVLVSQLVLVIVVGVDLNVLPINLVPVEDRITAWLEAARQLTAPPKHTAHRGVWRSEGKRWLDIITAHTSYSLFWCICEGEV